MQKKLSAVKSHSQSLHRCNIFKFPKFGVALKFLLEFVLLLCVVLVFAHQIWRTPNGLIVSWDNQKVVDPVRFMKQAYFE